ncbi:type VI secretion system tube protein TssD [Enterobacter sp. RHBSTW-00175]|uniref:type VI secretion system tube protein TssD n=1 Tax=Enterobacter sp. RHBSTW-00175 TaxID=2742639 RepID=UPI0015E8FBEE|nr:type VI secretion system tube protein TssD [Enterobacter sp. RHBSTW-00175]QMR76874.1 type VI secretion system tube protein Hcp [Enterobacter sp. RHBSTW-00175]
MGDTIYLSISGKQQGAISDGCGTIASIGNRAQTGHKDEIFVFELTNGITSTDQGTQLQELSFKKPLDKSTPLLCNAINNNEQLFLEFDFYRINKYGRWERYYYIQLRGAFISAIHLLVEANLDTEYITVKYEYIFCRHLIANTEFSSLAVPANYTRMFVPQQTDAKKGLKTLNSKAVGRLLAAGSIYNGNIEGFRDTAEKLGTETQTGYNQVLNEKTIGLGIAATSLLLAKNASALENLNKIQKIQGSIRNDLAGSIRKVNLGYPGEGRTHNCVNCALSTDMTLAGHATSALPANSITGVPLSVLERHYDAKFRYMKSEDEIIQIISSAGSGARGIVYGSYGPSQPGHVFNVVNQNSTIRFLDGQTGTQADLSQFESFQLLRTNK